MSNKLLRPLLFALAFLVIFQLLNGKKAVENTTDDIVLSGKDKVSIGKEVIIDIRNNSDLPIIIPNHCPENPLTVERYVNGEWEEKTAEIDSSNCEDASNITLVSGKKTTLKFGKWNQGLFGEEGRYRISVKTELDQKEKVYSYEINITPPSAIGRFFSEIFYRPIFNALVFLISILPGHSLGLAIILITIIVKIILLGPNHKALKAQKAMQKVQPQLDALKVKYKDEPQKLAQETMAIWKKYKVSPASSCLPMLIQFPILIALFYSVKNGLSVFNPDILYSSLQNFDLNSVNAHFLSLDLTKVNLIVLPIIVGGLQFVQMKLTLGKTQKTNTPAKKGEINPMPAMNKMMQYTMPIMIAVFTASMPAAVGFYWGTSTLFGIGQQVIVNRSKD